MKNPIKILLTLFALFGVGLVVLAALFERVEPGVIGVKQNMWGDSGVIEKDHMVGYHWGVTGMHRWYRLDRRTHFLTFAEADNQMGSSRRHANAQEERPLEIRTKDNNPVSLDVTVTYRIIAGEAHAIVREGLKNDYKARVASRVQSVLREELAKLTPGDFVKTDLRLRLTDKILPLLEGELAEFHVKPESILIRAVRFLDKYEEKLQETQLTQQYTELAKSKRKVEDALGATGKIEKETEAMAKELRADWDKKLQEASSNNQVRVAEIIAEAEIYRNQVRPRADARYETLVAEGKLSVAKAEALRDQLRNEALDTLGGRILQARNAAENLDIESVTLNSNDPEVPSIIDIDELTNLLVGDRSTEDDE